MFRTEATSSGADRPHAEGVLVQGDGDAQRGQERHLPEVIWREHRARAVGPGVRGGGGRGGGQHLNGLRHNQL